MPLVYNGLTTVKALELPAGIWQIDFKISLELAGAGNTNVRCSDFNLMSDQAHYSLPRTQGGHVQLHGGGFAYGPGRIEVKCYNWSAGKVTAKYEHTWIRAVQVSAVTVQS